VARFFWMFRRLATSTLSEEDCVIGGPGVVVEIDETKLGRRKYNRGHRVDGCGWWLELKEPHRDVSSYCQLQTGVQRR
jgi:hypothetical protein